MRIKTLGDCYCCVSGMPVSRPNHAENVVKTGLQMVTAIKYVLLIWPGWLSASCRVCCRVIHEHHCYITTVILKPAPIYQSQDLCQQCAMGIVLKKCVGSSRYNRHRYHIYVICGHFSANALNFSPLDFRFSPYQWKTLNINLIYNWCKLCQSLVIKISSIIWQNSISPSYVSTQVWLTSGIGMLTYYLYHICAEKNSSLQVVFIPL